MANRYGQAALIAAEQASSGSISPVARWENAMEAVYPTSPAARNKGGPRGAFLGLCEEGLVKGIPAGSYAATKLNKAYAIRAVALLADEAHHWSTTTLWQAVTGGIGKTHNSQMDIVLALWNNGHIVNKP